MPKITKAGLAFFDIVRQYGGETVNADRAMEVCSLLSRHSKTLHNLFTVQCNGSPLWLTDEVERRWRSTHGHAFVDGIRLRAVEEAERREIIVRRRVCGLVRELAAVMTNISGVDIGGDPRGPAFRLVTANGRGNSFVGGICSPR